MKYSIGDTVEVQYKGTILKGVILNKVMDRYKVKSGIDEVFVDGHQIIQLVNATPNPNLK